MMGSGMQWMIRHDVERACGQVLVTPATPARYAVARSSGSAELDRLMLESLRREIEDLRRMHLKDFPLDERGRRVVELNLDFRSDGKRGRNLGCPPFRVS